MTPWRTRAPQRGSRRADHWPSARPDEYSDIELGRFRGLPRGRRGPAVPSSSSRGRTRPRRYLAARISTLADAAASREPRLRELAADILEQAAFSALN
ncbi:MAG: hypothetical protein ACRDSP_00150 [Pseudonocardiaceae bacterium]